MAAMATCINGNNGMAAINIKRNVAIIMRRIIMASAAAGVS